MGDHTFNKSPLAKEDRHAVQSERLKMTYKVTKTDDVISTVTGDSLITFRKKFHFPNDMGKLKELPIPLHIGDEDLLKILKLSDIDDLHYEVHYLSRYIDKEHLFKVGLSTQAGRSHAQMLKKLVKVLKAVTQPLKAPSK
ncbi:hypothetical protein IEQ34_010783 [Dendrobium chrysotoxum]|uniref:Uncharacterized protein n=1 Tax=Dendrobium chrysotoxum TaxID=161865 RepID=A0AAV7GVM0_DENCH|nr:hypothetical protein IEQ34_010783 [Dendrobium chrysotoxum]